MTNPIVKQATELAWELREQNATNEDIAHLTGLPLARVIAIFEQSDATNDVPGSDPDVFIKKAKEIVKEHYTSLASALEYDTNNLETEEIYVVWFAKTLGNWKALLATTRPDGQYFEVTYNGTKKEAYLDTYVKVANDCIRDEEV